MKTKKIIIFILILVLILISSTIATYYTSGFTTKTVSIIIAILATLSIKNNLQYNFFIKSKEKDERNVIIENAAKAMAFNVAGIVLSILIIILVFLNTDIKTILLVFVAYISIVSSYFFYFSKYHKQM